MFEAETELVRDTAREFVRRECDEWRTLRWDQSQTYPKPLFDILDQPVKEIVQHVNPTYYNASTAVSPAAAQIAAVPAAAPESAATVVPAPTPAAAQASAASVEPTPNAEPAPGR